MASSENDIANKALRHLGVSQSVDFRTGRSKEDRVVLSVYDDAVDTVLRDAPWPFATELVNLAQSATAIDSDEYAYTYAYPADCVMFRRIVSGLAIPDSRRTQVKYRIIRGRFILTNQPDAVAEFTFRETDVAVWDADFAEAVSLYVAVLIAPALMKADTFKLADRALQLYQWRLGLAKANAFNEEVREEDQRSEFERSRD
jgi:hypothetical protein